VICRWVKAHCHDNGAIDRKSRTVVSAAPLSGPKILSKWETGNSGSRPPGLELSVRNTHIIDSVSLRDRTASSHLRILHPILHPRGSYLRSSELSATAHVPPKWTQIRSKSWDERGFRNGDHAKRSRASADVIIIVITQFTNSLKTATL